MSYVFGLHGNLISKQTGTEHRVQHDANGSQVVRPQSPWRLFPRPYVTSAADLWPNVTLLPTRLSAAAGRIFTNDDAESPSSAVASSSVGASSPSPPSSSCLSARLCILSWTETSDLDPPTPDPLEPLEFLLEASTVLLGISQPDPLLWPGMAAFPHLLRRPRWCEHSARGMSLL